MSVSNPAPFVSMGNAFSGNNSSNHTSPSSQIVKSKIMVVAVAVLFAAVVFIICLHVYAKWFWRHQAGVLGVARSGSWRRRRASRRNIDPLAADYDPQQQPLFLLYSVGLEKTVVESLPTFIYKKASFVQDSADMSSLPQQQLECAVCIEEFADNETGRTLPKCGHNFHVECIDMWLHSHSTCPLCRASARPDGPALTQKQSPELAHRGDGAVNEADRENTGATPRSYHDQQQQSSITPDLDFRLSGSSLARASTANEEESAAAGPPAPTTDPSEATTGRGIQQEGETEHHRPPSGTAKSLRIIPSNVLFRGIGMDSSSVQEAVSQQLGVAATASGRSSSATTAVQAPFQIVIDTPRGGVSAPEPSSSPFSSTPKSPMARFSSLKRLLSRGKTVAAPLPPPISPSSPSSSSPSVSSSSPVDLEQAPAPSSTAHS